MHRIRHRAHGSAWYTEDGQTNYNPFGRVRQRTRRLDIESGRTDAVVNRGIEDTSPDDRLHAGNTFASEADVRLSGEIARKQHFAAPRSANTLPPDSADSASYRGAFARDGNIKPVERSIEAELEHQPATHQMTGEKSEEKAGEEAGEKAREEPKETSEDSTAAQIIPIDDVKPAKQSWIQRLLWKSPEEYGPHRSSSSSSKMPVKFTFASQIRATLFNSWINVLLIAAPVGIALNFAHVSPVVVFVVNFIAIIPLAALLSFATEEIALRTSETLGGLLNASFGNAVELIVSIIALVQNQILIVQTSLIGSILSNLLLVLGMAFHWGGFNRPEQHFNKDVAQTASSLLALAVGSLIIPTAFSTWALGGSSANEKNVIALSRGTSILLLLVYGCYLYFQLKSHADLYSEPSQKVPKRPKSRKDDKPAPSGVAAKKKFLKFPRFGKGKKQQQQQQQQLQNNKRSDDNGSEENDDREEPQLSLMVAIITLAASTTVVALCAEFMVDNINAVVESSGISKNFVGLILLPIVGNAAEHATAVTVACHDKLDLAIGVAVGSSLQIALFVLPFIVTLGWALGKSSMGLNFDGFQIAVLFVAVLLVNYLIGDGKSHWLEGVMLQTLYLIIAVAAWYYPAKGNAA